MMLEDRLQGKFDFMYDKYRCEHKKVKYDGICMVDELEFATYQVTCRDCHSSLSYKKGDNVCIVEGLYEFNKDYMMLGNLPKQKGRITRSMYAYQQKLLKDMYKGTIKE